MKRERDTAPSPLDESASTPRDPASPKAAEPTDPEASRDPEPSDPDAAMYAAIAARPSWLEKPKVKQLIKELSEGLGPGEDLFYWDMRRRRQPRAIQPSDVEEHRILTVPPQTEVLSQTLPSARVIVHDPPIESRPSPGRNGPKPAVEGAGQGGKALSRSSSQRPLPWGVPRWCLAAMLFGVALLSAAFTLLVLYLGAAHGPIGATPAASPSRGAAAR